MASSLRQVLEAYSEICIFCSVIKEVYINCWQNLWKLSLIKLVFQLICIVSSNSQDSPGKPFPQLSEPFPLHPPRQNNFLIVYLLLNSKPQKTQLEKSKEFQNLREVTISGRCTHVLATQNVDSRYFYSYAIFAIFIFAIQHVVNPLTLNC